MQTAKSRLDQMWYSSVANDSWIDKEGNKIFSYLRCLNRAVEMCPSRLKHSQQKHRVEETLNMYMTGLLQVEPKP